MRVSHWRPIALFYLDKRGFYTEIWAIGKPLFFFRFGFNDWRKFGVCHFDLTNYFHSSRKSVRIHSFLLRKISDSNLISLYVFARITSNERGEVVITWLN